MKRCALVHGAVRPDEPAVAVNGSHDRRQSDSFAGKFAVAMPPVKRTKQPLGVSHVKPGTVVSHEVQRYAAVLDRAEANTGIWGAGGELERVREQVLQHAPNKRKIDLGAQPVLDLDLDPAVRLGALQVGDDLARQCAQIERHAHQALARQAREL